MSELKESFYLNDVIEGLIKQRRSLEPAREIRFASKILENAAYSLSGDIEQASVARLILLAHELERMSERIAST